MKPHIKPCNCQTCLEAREQALRNQKKEMVKMIEENGTIIHQGELPKGIYGLLIDIEKLKMDIYILLESLMCIVEK